MNKTLFDLTYELARALGIVSEGVATGGSTTTLVDTVELTQADDFWNGGSVWVLYDAGGAGAAPQGEYSVVSDFTASSDTATLRSTLTAAIASGDRYAIARKKYPLHILTQYINQALSEIPVQKDDITTITIAADQTEYSLPSDVWKLKQVWLQNNDDSNDNEWGLLTDWSVKKSATGTANVLELGEQFTAGYELKLVYLTEHQTLRAATDKLDNTIHSNRVLYNAAVGCLLWRKAKVGESDTNVNDLLNFYQAKAQEMNAQFAVSYPQKSAKTIHLSLDRP
jgi:hypothetical protein